LKVLRQLQTLQQTMQSNASSQLEMEEKMRKLQQMKQQEEEFDKHLAQTVPVSSDNLKNFFLITISYITNFFFYITIVHKIFSSILEPSICI